MNDLIILNVHTEIRAWAGVFATLAAMIVIFVVLFATVEHSLSKRIILICVAVVFLAVFFVCGWVVPDETVIQAYVPDGVSVSEVIEKYDIRKVDGRLLTLVQKEE